MGGRGSQSKRTAYTLRMTLGSAPPPQPDEEETATQEDETATTGNLDQIRDPKDILDYLTKTDRAGADAMLAQWRAETLDGDNRQQNTDTQRFFNYIGWAAETPEVLTEAQYQQAWQAAGQPTQIYHSDNPYNGVGARQFAAQYMGRSQSFSGDTYRHFLSGGVHGDGTYFADTARESAFYGSSQFRGFLNNNAKVITEAKLDSTYQTYSKKYPALRHLMNQLSTGYGNGYSGARSVFAAMLGYNVIDATHHSGYSAVLNRKATTVSDKTKKTSYGMSDW